MVPVWTRIDRIQLSRWNFLPFLQIFARDFAARSRLAAMSTESSGPLPPKSRRVLNWAWMTMMILALAVAVALGVASIFRS
jgi:hypothetical protein